MGGPGLVADGIVRWFYALATLALFLTELGIALFVHDRVVRPFLGDVLVVILIFCFLRTLLVVDGRRLALGVLALACTVEVLQYFDYVRLLGLEHNRVLSVALGRTFAWDDFLAYLTGYAAIRLALARGWFPGTAA